MPSLTAPNRQARSFVTCAAQAGPAGFFVWATWGTMLAAFLELTSIFAPRIPSMDEWHFIPIMLGQQPLTLAWLFHPWAEHRVPLTRLVLWGTARLFGYHPAIVSFVNVALISALAATFVLTVQRVRGQARFSDAFFPVLLMRFNPLVLQDWIQHHVQFVVLAGVLLCLAFVSRRPWSLGRSLIASACLLLLPWTGAMGAAVVPALAVWLGLLGLGNWPTNRRVSVFLLAVAAIGLFEIPLYFRGMHRYEGFIPPSAATMGATAEGALAFLTTGLSSDAARLWPLLGGLAAFFLLWSAVLSLQEIRLSKSTRAARSGLIFAALALSGLAVAIGWGRSGLGIAACLKGRYTLLAALAWCWAYLVAVRAGNAWLQVSLACVIWALLPLNLTDGFRKAEHNRSQAMALERDIRSGMPVEALMERHADALLPSWDGQVNPWNKLFVLTALRALHHAHVGVFAELRGLPP